MKIRWLLAQGCLTLALSSAALTSPRDARAADPAEARATARGHFNRGVELAKARSYEEALAAFEQAYAVSPHFSVLYNIGQAERALGRSSEAVRTLRRYLAEGGAQIDGARRAEVDATIAELSRTEAPGQADVADSSVTSSEATRPPAVTTPGEAPSPAAVTPPNAAPPRAALPASSPPPPPPAAPDSQRGKAEGNVERPLAYVLGAAGVALTAAAAAHYAWNRGRYEDWQSAYAAHQADPRPERRSVANALAESVDRASRVTIALSVGAGIVLGSGTVLFFSSSSEPPQSGRGERWLGLRGTF